VTKETSDGIAKVGTIYMECPIDVSGTIDGNKKDN